MLTPGTGLVLEPLKNEILKMREEGFSLREIGEELGYTHKTVSNYLRRIGVTGNNYSYFKDFTEHQRNVLVGSLMGDAGLVLQFKDRGHNPHLDFVHGKNQIPYLIWKANQFGSLFSNLNPYPHRKPDGSFVYQLWSRKHPVFTDYYKLFYNRPITECNEHVHKKQITRQILDLVNDEVLAIWWCDDGSMNPKGGYRGERGALTIHMGGMVLRDYELVESWFKEKGWNPKRNNWLDSCNRVSLRFSAEESEVLVKRILPFVPKEMLYKFGDLKYLGV